eukprot:g3234.t1
MILSPLTMLLGAYLAGEAHVELQAEPSEPSPNLTFETTRNPSNTRTFGRIRFQNLGPIPPGDGTGPRGSDFSGRVTGRTGLSLVCLRRPSECEKRGETAAGQILYLIRTSPTPGARAVRQPRVYLIHGVGPSSGSGQVRRLRFDPGAFEPLLEYILEYDGVLECHVEGQKPSEAPKQFLVIENPGVRDLCGSTFRRCDADGTAGWADGTGG